MWKRFTLQNTMSLKHLMPEFRQPPCHYLQHTILDVKMSSSSTCVGLAHRNYKSVVGLSTSFARQTPCSGRLMYKRPVLTSAFNQANRWDKAVSDAEKVVGYPTSFMNLRFWLSDEMSNVAVNMRKLIGTKHPLMKTAKGLLFDNKENMQTRGLVVLLISKAGGYPAEPREFPHHTLDKTYAPLELSTLSAPGPDGTDTPDNGILATQRSLAEITEMINTAFVLHKGVMNIDLSDKQKPFDSETEDLLYGNKMSLLSGDYLLAKASSGLSALGNVYVVEVMASAIADLMESHFYVDDLVNSKNYSKLDVIQWEQLAYKKGACLYAKSCQSALLLSEHCENVSDAGHTFGKYFGLLRQLKSDVEEPEDNLESITTILSHVEIEDLKNRYIHEATESLELLQNVEARHALAKILMALSSSK